MHTITLTLQMSKKKEYRVDVRLNRSRAACPVD